MKKIISIVELCGTELKPGDTLTMDFLRNWFGIPEGGNFYEQEKNQILFSEKLELLNNDLSKHRTFLALNRNLTYTVNRWYKYA